MTKWIRWRRRLSKVGTRGGMMIDEQAVQEYFPGSWKDSFLLDLDVPENVSSSKVFPQQQAIHAHYRNPKDVALALATSKHDDNTPNTLPALSPISSVPMYWRQTRYC